MPSTRRRFLRSGWKIGGTVLTAAVIWAGLFMGIGVLFSQQIQLALDLLASMGLAAFAVLIVICVGYLALRYWRRHVFLREVKMSRISVDELRELIQNGRDPVVIDVRSVVGRSIDLRRIPGALAIELDSVVRDCQYLARDREIVIYCNCPNEASAARAARLLAAVGFMRVRPLAGGLEAWVAAGHRVDQHDLVVAEA